MNHSFRHLRTRLLVAGISLAAFAGTNGVAAAEAGRVLFTSGDVRIIAPDGSSRAAKRGDIVQDGERMQTAQGALGQVQMIDGERVGVRGGSKVRFSPPPANTAQPRQIELESGRVRVLNVAGRGKPEMKPVEVKTPDGDLLMDGADVVVGFVRRSAAAGKAGDAPSTSPAARKVRAQINRGKVEASRGEQKLAMVAGQAAEFSQGTIERVTSRLNDLEPPATRPGTQLRPSDTAQDQRLGRTATPKGPIVKPGSFATSPRQVATTRLPGSVLRTPSLQPRIPSTSIARIPLVQASQLPIILGKETPTFTPTRETDANTVTLDTLLSKAGALTTGNRAQIATASSGTSKPTGPTLRSLAPVKTGTRLFVPVESTTSTIKPTRLVRSSVTLETRFFNSTSLLDQALRVEPEKTIPIVKR